jgi:hypothetical protein
MLSIRVPQGEGVAWPIALAAVILLGLVLYTSIVAQKSQVRKSFVVEVHLAWLLVFTWYGWFSTPSPFRPHELRIRGLFNGSDTAGPVAWEYVKAFAIYLSLVAVYSGIPLLCSQLPGKRTKSAEGSLHRTSEARILVTSAALFAAAFLDGVWNWMGPLVGSQNGEVVRTICALGAFALVCVPAGRGSLRALAFGLAEIAVIPVAWVLR